MNTRKWCAINTMSNTLALAVPPKAYPAGTCKNSSSDGKSNKPSLLIAAQPTWGVDAGAAAAIHQSILDLAEKGSAVLVLSQDLDEIFEVCDSVCVIYEGTLSDATRFPTSVAKKSDC